MTQSAESRYENDPAFHTLVDIIYKWVVENQYTPSEVRDAAMLAALHYEMYYARTHSVVPNINKEAP